MSLYFYYDWLFYVANLNYAVVPGIKEETNSELNPNGKE